MPWENLASSDWPSWVVSALDNDTLRSAWEGKKLLTLRGRTFLYRVTPDIIDQGHWHIAKIERQARGRRDRT